MTDDDGVVDFESNRGRHKQKLAEKKTRQLKKKFEKFLPMEKKPRVFKGKHKKKPNK